MMADLIARDGFISGPSSHRGAAAYWSTLRAPYAGGRHGKKFKIIPITRTFRDLSVFSLAPIAARLDPDDNSDLMPDAH